MEASEHIRKSQLACFRILEIMVLVFCPIQTAITISAYPVQVNFDRCTFKTFDFHLCTEGRAKIDLPNCSTPCCACPRGTFMDAEFNNCTKCKPMTDCKADGKEVLIEGNTTHDAVCGDYLSPTTLGPQLVTSTEGATSSSSTSISPTCHGSNDGNPWNLIFGTLLFIVLLVLLIFICRPGIPKYLNEVLPCTSCRAKRMNGI
ncbi:hypothetical protein HOLleu_38411 [Holothuria leucospilota]|uniref:TNFR-Cys domain-containing protein n=1 Tax=Holothuria leucospilota TaxID=206669 RepID=A0A9Q0YEA2_HOLLE|nr:hypothetical protein HOLleu_38411 [Holothuria leucospilota]